MHTRESAGGGARGGGQQGGGGGGPPANPASPNAGSTVAGNKARGDLFRDWIAQFFESLGYTVKKEVVKKTPFGDRRIDIEIYDENGNLVGALETKTGGSDYPPDQRSKDAWLKEQGYPVTPVRGD